MVRYSIESKRICLLEKKLSNKLDALITANKKVVHKAAEATGEVLGNKTADKIVKPKPLHDENLRDVEEKTIPPEKRKEILNELR